TFGRGSSLGMTTDPLANRAPPVQTHYTPSLQPQLRDVEPLQQAIAAGAAPTEDAYAPAAGNTANGAPGALGGGHTFVMLTEVAGRVDPQIGFPTAGCNGIPELATRYLGERSVDGDCNRGAPLQPPPVNPPEDHPVSLEGLDVK